MTYSVKMTIHRSLVEWIKKNTCKVLICSIITSETLPKALIAHITFKETRKQLPV